MDSCSYSDPTKPQGALAWSRRGDVASWQHQKKGQKPLNGRWVRRAGLPRAQQTMVQARQALPKREHSRLPAVLAPATQEQRHQNLTGANSRLWRHQASRTSSSAGQPGRGRVLPAPGAPSWPRAAGTALSGVSGTAAEQQRSSSPGSLFKPRAPISLCSSAGFSNDPVDMTAKWTCLQHVSSSFFFENGLVIFLST